MTVLGLQLQFVIIPVIFIVLILFALLSLWLAHRDDYYESGWALGVILGFVFAGIALAAGVISMIPFDTKYWLIYEKSGVIESVSNRFVNGSGDLTSSAYLVEFEDGSSVVLYDPRVLNAEGAQVSLTCTVEWVYLSADRLNCKFREVSS